MTSAHLPQRYQCFHRRWLLYGFVALLSGVAAEAQGPIKIAAGRRNDTYWKLASNLRQQPGLAIQLVATGGSGENLKLLEAGEVRFALAQQDVVRDYFREKGNAATVRVVDRIFFDYLHIFIRDSLHVEPGELGRLRIWMGEPGSETRLTASRLLDSLGTPISSFEGRSLSLESAGETAGPALTGWLAQQFRAERLDAAMLVSTPGLTEACNLMRRAPVTLLSLDPKTLRRLTDEEGTEFRKQTAIGRIPANTYSHQNAPVATIAVPILLLVRQKEDVQTARNILNAARTAWEDLAVSDSKSESSCPIPDSFPEAPSLEDSKLHILEGFKVDNPFWPKRRPVTIKLFLILGLGAASLLAIRRRWHEQVRVLWREDRLPFLLAFLLALGILAVTLITFSFEHGINENFTTIGESFWSITVYLFSGLEGRSPYTEEGRIVATFGLLLGPAFFAVMSGWFARFFIHREKRMPYNLRNHFLLLNWNARAADVVREIHHPIIREREGTFVVVVLTDDESLALRRFKEAGSGRDEAFEDFFVSVGDPTDERALRNANASDTRSILILTNDEHGDERTIRSILMLRKIAREVDRHDLHVVAELSDPANHAVLEELAKDFPGLLEPIAGLQIRTFLLSQAALSAGIVGFYSELLKISPITNEMYTLELPPGVVGLTFRDYAAMVLRTYPDEPLVPVGVQRMIDGRSRMLTNPRRGDPGWILEEGDRLLVMAYLPPLPGALPMPEVVGP
ncbi:MAG TPA: TAXI family TRAP transporter solute-binding subunit [Thermoanaerobaculia bacterium]|nr:TAXI family TRAP transporter solute-binding subunit [Thermoanaerobaculia bacterium]